MTSEEQGGIRIVRLDHGKANALDLESLRRLRKELDDAASSSADRAIVLTASGRIFSAGVDLLRVLGGAEEYFREFLPLLHEVCTAFFRFPKPAVAAVNGHAIAGGCVLAQACDYRLMSNTAAMGLAELRAGVAFPRFALTIARYALPPQHVQEIVLFGRTYQAAEALAKGMVDELTEPDDLLPRAVTLAQGLAEAPADAFRITKLRLRETAIAAIESDSAVDEETLANWSDPATHARIREYMERATRGRRPS